MFTSYIAVTFQLRSSINMRLTESFLYNRSPKMGFSRDFGDRGEEIWWESTSVFKHLWSRFDVPYSRILYGYRHLP